MGQLLNDPVKKVDISYKGAVTELNTNPISTAALAGLMRALIPDVNMVSAPKLAKDHGIIMQETYAEDAEGNESLIRLAVKSGSRNFVIVGTVFRGQPRIVRLFGVPMDAGFAQHMLYVRNEDKPGFIGALGQILGEAGINIATFSLGRMDNGENEAVCLVSIDDEVPEKVVEQIKAVNQVKIVSRVEM